MDTHKMSPCSGVKHRFNVVGGFDNVGGHWYVLVCHFCRYKVVVHQLFFWV